MFLFPVPTRLHFENRLFQFPLFLFPSKFGENPLLKNHAARRLGALGFMKPNKRASRLFNLIMQKKWKSKQSIENGGEREIAEE